MIEGLNGQIALRTAAASCIAVHVVNPGEVGAEGELIFPEDEIKAPVVLIAALSARKSKSDFLHVRDAARAFMLCMEAEPGGVAGEIFNVGDYNLNYRLTDVSKLVAGIVPHVEVTHVDNGDQRNYRVSFDKIHSRLGFQTEITLEEGIRELYEWIKPNHTIDLSAAPQFNNQAMIREFAQSAAAQQSTLRMLQSLAECA